MSTRANIVIESPSWNEKLWFYRHSDGYPDGALPTLKKFMSYVSEGRIRDNVSQAAGWLVLIGADEYGHYHSWHDQGERPKTRDELVQPSNNSVSGWKVGAYEPTVGVHGDIEFLYVLDLDAKTIKVYDSWSETGEVNGHAAIDIITDFS